MGGCVTACPYSEREGRKEGTHTHTQACAWEKGGREGGRVRRGGLAYKHGVEVKEEEEVLVVVVYFLDLTPMVRP